jgi:hypothetical protein
MVPCRVKYDFINAVARTIMRVEGRRDRIRVKPPLDGFCTPSHLAKSRQVIGGPGNIFALHTLNKR